MNRRTLRGKFTEGTQQRLVVDDGNLNHGYKVVRFVVAGDGFISAGTDAMATLSIDQDSPKDWDWGDNRQIGWASTVTSDVAGLAAPFSLVDPDHIVLRDLFIQGQSGSAGGTGIINYLVELEPMTISNDQAVITLIKERAQDDL